MPDLTVNGEVRSFPEASFPETVARLLVALSLEGDGLVAEVDGAVVRGEDFAACRLEPGARVELVQFIGGG